MKPATPQVGLPAHDAALAWLLSPGAEGLGGEAVLERLFELLVAEGIALYRCATALLTSHPEVFVRNVIWTRGEGSTSVARKHDLAAHPDYAGSPVALVHAGSGPIRRKLEGPEDAIEFAALRAMARKGITDYLIVPLVFRDGFRNFISWSTDRQGGFSEAEIARLSGLTPVLALRLELESAHFATASLLRVYLGHNAAGRVLAGDFRRGGGESLRAAIWYADLRDFTGLVDGHPVGEVVPLLDGYFEAAANAVSDCGGEILKFIGDAVLAIFVLGDAGPERACQAALAAAEKALATLSALNARHPALPPLEMGIGLHLGEVMYGNVGGRERLDFTVIGAAVNEVTRIESLCKSLGVPLLMSGAFAQSCGSAEAVSLGEHRLRGVRQPREVATLRRFKP